jgi:hypothetical protein
MIAPSLAAGTFLCNCDLLNVVPGWPMGPDCRLVLANTFMQTNGRRSRGHPPTTSSSFGENSQSWRVNLVSSPPDRLCHTGSVQIYCSSGARHIEQDNMSRRHYCRQKWRMKNAR